MKKAKKNLAFFLIVVLCMLPLKSYAVEVNEEAEDIETEITNAIIVKRTRIKGECWKSRGKYSADSPRKSFTKFNGSGSCTGLWLDVMEKSGRNAWNYRREKTYGSN